MLSESEKKKIAEAIREDVYQVKGIQKLLCRGKCMVPILYNNVEVLVKDCRLDEVSIGDIMLYSYEDCLMLHRYIYKKKGRDGAIQIITKADTALNFDPPISAESLIGKVVELDRNGRTIRVVRYPWLLAFRIIGILSLLEATVYSTLFYLKTKVFKRLVVRYQYRKLILKAIKKPKLLFTQAVVRFMQPPDRDKAQERG